MLKNVRRTHTCGQLRAEDIGQTVLLQGWAHSVRDLGGVCFLNLRDRSGLVQITIDERCAPSVLTDAQRVRQEYVIEVQGQVVERARPNAKMPTGRVEILATAVTILNRTEPLPFAIEGGEAHEDTRLKYRFLDLRRPSLQAKLIARHRAAQAARRYLDELGFLEIETPILNRSTPEGARDYLVPSRVHPASGTRCRRAPRSSSRS